MYIDKCMYIVYVIGLPSTVDQLKVLNVSCILSIIL